MGVRQPLRAGVVAVDQRALLEFLRRLLVPRHGAIGIAGDDLGRACATAATAIFLFGEFGAADIMYGPVVTRLNHPFNPRRALCAALHACGVAHPFVQNLIAAAREEDWVIEKFEGPVHVLRDVWADVTIRRIREQSFRFFSAVREMIDVLGRFSAYRRAAVQVP
ncbi:MAG: hypothetical protein H7X93_08970 [Sphingomonadaceae bacterium]|nr:hypothetical protein [Sphingomonadaceae bacterium]